MIALDTNLLLRYFDNSDSAESLAAKGFVDGDLSRSQTGFVSVIVLAELHWVMRSSYGMASADIADYIRLLLESPKFSVEQPASVAASLAHTGQDFADTLLHEIGQRSGCYKTVTFDRKFARLEKVELLTS